MAITLPVSWAEICFWATSSSNLMMLFRSMAPSSLLQKLSTTIKLHAEGRESCTNQQHITSKNKYLVPRLRRAFFRDAHNDGTIWVQNWRPERGDAARQEKLSSLTGWDTISRAETHFCSVDFVLYGSRQAHATSIRGYLKSTAFFLVNQAWLTWSLKILVSVWSGSPDCSSSQAHFTNCRGSS